MQKPAEDGGGRFAVVTSRKTLVKQKEDEERSRKL